MKQGVLALMILTVTAAQARAATIPFTEGFDASASGWLNNASGPLNHVGSGGQDGGGYVATEFNFVDQVVGGQGPVLFRGNATASGAAFTGNWISDGVGTLSAWVRHDSEIPLNYFARFAAPAGFPGAIAIDFTPVAAATGSDGWTELQFAISPSSPQFVSFEGSDFATIFSNVGRVQFGVSVPAGVDRVIHFELDSVRISGAAPEPAALGLVLLAASSLFVRRAMQGTRRA